MDWQTFAVVLIGLLVAAVLLRWIWRLLTGRNRCSCGDCRADGCPHGGDRCPENERFDKRR